MPITNLNGKNNSAFMNVKHTNLINNQTIKRFRVEGLPVLMNPPQIWPWSPIWTGVVRHPDEWTMYDDPKVESAYLSGRWWRRFCEMSYTFPSENDENEKETLMKFRNNRVKEPLLHTLSIQLTDELIKCHFYVVLWFYWMK